MLNINSSGHPTAQVIADTLASAEEQARAAQYIDERASRGLRSIAVAQAPAGPDGTAAGGWRLVGLISLLDPPRPDSAATIKRAQELGVEVGYLDVHPPPLLPPGACRASGSSPFLRLQFVANKLQ